jgi:type VI secretion system protein VasG
MRVAVDASIVEGSHLRLDGHSVGKMLRDQLSMMLELERHVGARLIGQDHAIAAISRRVRTSAAKIEDPNKPKGVFMLVGPSGVGKTETALVLSDLLFGGEQNMVTINMSEYQEAHTVSSLKGSPPGYVGYGEGGVLTEAVRRKPYSVVLLDEVGKHTPTCSSSSSRCSTRAAWRTARGGRSLQEHDDLATTNAGTQTIMTLTADAETMPSRGFGHGAQARAGQDAPPAFRRRSSFPTTRCGMRT